MHIRLCDWNKKVCGQYRGFLCDEIVHTAEIVSGVDARPEIRVLDFDGGCRSRSVLEAIFVTKVIYPIALVNREAATLEAVLQ